MEKTFKISRLVDKICKGMIGNAQLATKLKGLKAKLRGEDKKTVRELARDAFDNIRIGTMALNEVNQMWSAQIREDLNPIYRSLCNPPKEEDGFLFGSDVTEKIIAINQSWNIGMMDKKSFRRAQVSAVRQSETPTGRPSTAGCSKPSTQPVQSIQAVVPTEPQSEHQGKRWQADSKEVTRKKDTLNIIMHAWKDGTKKQYECYLKKWRDFVERKDIDIYSPTVQDILEFLTILHNKGLGYSALNTSRSSLSSIISIEGKPAGEHLLVTKFMKGAFNLRPANPKTNCTWDPEILLKYLKTLSPVKKLSFKMLTYKAVTLLWLLCGQRGQGINLS